MAGNSVAARTSQVPDLVRTPALDIGVGDIALPKIRVAQFMSKAMINEVDGVKLGQLIASSDPEDPNPDILYDPRTSTQGLLIHVIGLEKGKSLQTADGKFEVFAYNDPDAPPAAWRTYTYTVAVPEADPDVPHKILMTKSAMGTALKINTVLSKTAAKGPPWNNAFRLTTAERSNDNGKWAVVQASLVDADPANVAIAESLAVMLSANPVEHTATGEQPAI